MYSNRHQPPSVEVSRQSDVDLLQQVAEMRAELEQYRTEVGLLRQQIVPSQESGMGDIGSVTSRRKMLKHMVAGVAGVSALSLATMVGSSQIVQAETTGETAIDAQGGAGGYGGKFTSSFAQLQLVPATGVPLPTSFANRNTGELFVDQNGALYYAVNSAGTAGTPDRWVKLAGPSTAGSLHLLNPPSRFIDTRAAPTGINDVGNPIAHQVARTYNITGLTGRGGATIPTGATGIVGNVTVAGSSTTGYIQISPTTPGGTDPSTLNYNVGITCNSFSVALSSAGNITVMAAMVNTAATINLIIDITGYYR
jgi:hypothetical protein